MGQFIRAIYAVFCLTHYSFPVNRRVNHETPTDLHVVIFCHLVSASTHHLRQVQPFIISRDKKICRVFSGRENGTAVKDIGLGWDFLSETPIAQEITSRINKCNYVKLKSICTTKKQPTEERERTGWETTFASYTVDKWLMFINFQLFIPVFCTLSIVLFVTVTHTHTHTHAYTVNVPS